MKKRKRLTPEQWAEIEADNETVARRLESRIAKMKAEREKRSRSAMERPAQRRRLFGLL